MPILYNKKIHKSIPSNAILIDRTTKWGNPFKIGVFYQGRVLTREDCIEAFEDWLLYSDQGLLVLQDIDELIDKDLICWCVPAKCHGIILMREAALAKLRKQKIVRAEFDEKLRTLLKLKPINEWETLIQNASN